MFHSEFRTKRFFGSPSHPVFRFSHTHTHRERDSFPWKTNTYDRNDDLMAARKAGNLFRLLFSPEHTVAKQCVTHIHIHIIIIILLLFIYKNTHTHMATTFVIFSPHSLPRYKMHGKFNIYDHLKYKPSMCAPRATSGGAASRPPYLPGELATGATPDAFYCTRGITRTR